MTAAIIAASARRRSYAPPTAELPYAMPTAFPYNVPTYAITPTPDGTGSTIHPDVVDTVTGWNGYRYWMATTPFYQEAVQEENPCVLASHNGFHWEVPAGGFNPLDPWPGAGYNSDTDMILVDGVMYVVWRWYTGGARTLWCRTSTDGVTWTAKTQIDNGVWHDPISPAIVHKDGTWRMWTTGGSGVRLRTADSLLDGPWANDWTDCTFTGTSVPIWHTDVIWHEDRYWMLIDSQYLASSFDGLAWTIGGPAITHGGAGAWDQERYRGTLQPHPDGTHMQVWYSGSERNPTTSDISWRIGFTQIPLNAWAAPPTP